MNPAFFPSVIILVVFLTLVAKQAGLALGKGAGMVADRITLWRLSRICGSRARANRLVRAVELETRTNALIPLARIALSSRTSAGAVGGSALFASPVPQKKLVVGSVTR